jgi:hypothetical protein
MARRRSARDDMRMSSASPPSTQRRARPDRTGERRSTPGHREADTEGHFAVVPALWALVGAMVVGYAFFLALAAVRPGDAPVATIVALALGLVWIAHAWRRVLIGSRSPVGDRERRGF